MQQDNLKFNWASNTCFIDVLNGQFVRRMMYSVKHYVLSKKIQVLKKRASICTPTKFIGIE